MANNQGTISNISWKLAERLSAQLISTIVSIILARILEPEHYGVIAIVMIFITIANVFVSDGFGSALIQKKNATAEDFFSVLYFNIAFSIVLYIIIFLAAPLIARFYGAGYEVLTPVLRVLGLRIILTAVNSVQQAYISIKMMFRKFFVSTLGGTIASAVVGIYMAYAGFGIWSLVAQYLVSTTVSTVVLFFVLKIKPRIIFSFRSLKELFPFGARVLGVGLLVTGYMELRAMMIGKIYSSEDLAYYDKGKQFPNLFVTNINSSISAVLFPKIAMAQDDKAAVKDLTRASIRTTCYFISPLMIGLAAVSTQFVTVLLTEKWLPCVPLLQLFCITYMFQPIHSANIQAIKAIGRGDVYLWLEVIKKTIEIIILIIVMRISVNAIVVAMAVCAGAFLFLNAIPNIKLLGYSLKEQIFDIIPSFFMSGIMFFAVWLLGMIKINTVLLLAIQVVAGVLIYVFLSVITRNKEFIYIKNLILAVFRKNKNTEIQNTNSSEGD